MSTLARDLLELRADAPRSPELLRLAMNIIAPGVKSYIKGGL